MQAMWSQFVFDLRRLAPWVVAYGAFWMWRALAFDFEDFGRLGWPVMLQELAAIIFLGALVSESPLFGRRAFWRTRAIEPTTLLGGRVLFLAFVLWLPRVLASYQILSFLEGSPLRLLVLLDVMTYQALWLLSLLALVSLVRRPIEVVGVPVAIAFGLGPADMTLRGALDQMLFNDPSDVGRAAHQLMHTAVSLGLSIAVVLGLLALYRRQRGGWRVGALCAILAVLVPAALVPPLVKSMWPHPQIDPPPILDLTLQKNLQYPIYYDGPATVLRTQLVSKDLPEDLGLQLLSAQGELTTLDGDVLTIRGEAEDACQFPAALLHRIPALSLPTRQPVLSCGPDLRLPLSLRGRKVAAEEPLQGTLELHLYLKAFRAEAQLVDATPGATLHHGFETFVVHQVDPPLGGQRTYPRFHLRHFFLGNTRHSSPNHTLAQHDGHSLTAEESHLRLLDTANDEMAHWGTSSSSSSYHFELGPFSRLWMEPGDLVPRHRRLEDGEVLQAPHFQLLDLNLVYSPEIAVTLRIEDFRFGGGN